MTTFRAPKLSPVDKAERLRPRASERLLSKLWPSGPNRRTKVTLIEAGLFVLVASTTMAIGSISLWWVPAYLVVVVVIFVTPARWQAASSVSESGVECDAVSIFDQDSGFRVDCAEGPDKIRSFGQLDSDLASIDPTESMDSNSDLITAGATKRRGRLRVRKATHPANEPVINCRLVAWIQVGPGKFIRVEGGNQAANRGQIEDVALRAYPATEMPAEPTPLAPAETEPLAELKSFTSSGIFPNEIGLISVSDDCVSGSAAEEYGITPSAFSPATGYNSSVEASVHDLPGQVDEPEVNLTARGESSNPPLPVAQDSGPFHCQREISRSCVTWIHRGIIRTDPRVDRASRRSGASRSANSQFLVGLRYAPNASRREAARWAMDRLLRVRRLVRARSPPCSRSDCSRPA
jgi:hypothetical protein